MISREVDDSTVSATAEDADDLLDLRRIIKEGDRIIGSTTRAVKKDREYSRPDRGERVRIRIALDVQSVRLDSAIDRLRVSGTIAESDHEEVARGSHHSMIVRAGEPLAIRKKRWSPVERRLARRKGPGGGFVLIAIDTADCGIARLDGTRLQLLPNIYSGSGGKRYKTSFSPDRFFGEVAGAVQSAAREGDRIIAFGPGQSKNRLANFAAGKKLKLELAEGIDSGGEDGIYMFTKSEAMRQAMAGSKLARISEIIDEVMAMAGRKGRRFAMGYAESKNACQLGAVDSLVFSDKILEEAGEQEAVDLLNDAEARGARVYGVDSSTDLGLRVTGLGGIVAILRFSVEP